MDTIILWMENLEYNYSLGGKFWIQLFFGGDIFPPNRDFFWILFMYTHTETNERGIFGLITIGTINFVVAKIAI